MQAVESFKSSQVRSGRGRSRASQNPHLPHTYTHCTPSTLIHTHIPHQPHLTHPTLRSLPVRHPPPTQLASIRHSAIRAHPGNGQTTACQPARERKKERKGERRKRYLRTYMHCSHARWEGGPSSHPSLMHAHTLARTHARTLAWMHSSMHDSARKSQSKQATKRRAPPQQQQLFPRGSSRGNPLACLPCLSAWRGVALVG